MLCIKVVVIFLVLFRACVPTVVTAESFYWSAGIGISILIQKYPE